MRTSYRKWLLLCGSLAQTGCLQPWNWRLPTIWNKSPEIERVEYQYHDPFPDRQTGPDTGSRPLLYNDQRPLPVRVREKYDGTRIRTPAPGAVPPPSGASPGSGYPQVVPF